MRLTVFGRALLFERHITSKLRFRIHWWHQNRLVFVSVTKRWSWLCYRSKWLDFANSRNLAHLFLVGSQKFDKRSIMISTWNLPVKCMVDSPKFIVPHEQPKRLICEFWLAFCFWPSYSILLPAISQKPVARYDHLDRHLYCIFPNSVNYPAALDFS